jgi:hypothetical protein
MAYFYFDFRDVDKQNFPLCFPLCLSNFPLAPIPVVTYSPNFIRPTTVEYGNLAIGKWSNA